MCYSYVETMLFESDDMQITILNKDDYKKFIHNEQLLIISI
jgi:hypothetical protein